ncbi:MAG: DcaP family trimeric outer membrane transporter [Sandaracinobacteroides sp.]
MPNRHFVAALAAGCAAAAMLPAPLLAQASPREAQLEARLALLEAAVAQLKSELAASKAPPAAAAAIGTAQAPVAAPAAAPAADTETRLAALEKRPVPPADGFSVGSTNLAVHGFVKLWGAVSNTSGGAIPAGSFGRDFYLPQAIPVGGLREGSDFNLHAKQTRLWMTSSTPAGADPIKGHIEIDAQTAPGTQASQRTTNGYDIALRRAFFSWGGLLAGQEWSTFQNVGALPETTDFIGPTEGTVFVRQAQIRYTHKLSPNWAIAVALENAETASITPTSPGIIENDDDRLPDLVARVAYTAGKSEVSLAGLYHQLSVDTGTASDTAGGWGLSLAGKLALGSSGRHDLRFMASGGRGTGHYLGLNFAPDAIFDGARLNTVGVVAGFAALKLGWTPTLRSTFMGSFQTVDYGGAVVPLAANDSAWSAAGNLFWTPVKGIDVGIEFRHGNRELVSGASGQLDRFEFATKYTF